MVRMKIGLLISVFISALFGLYPALSAATDSKCELRLMAAAQFPNGEYELAFGQWDRKTLPVDIKYEKALASLPTDIEAVSFNYFSGGQMYFQSVEQFIGQVIVGVNIQQNPDTLIYSYQYISGTVTAAKALKNLGYDQLQLTIKTLDETKEITLHPNFYILSGQTGLNQVYILDSIKSTDERIRTAFQYVNFPLVIEGSFGAPATAEDFAVAYAAIETYLTLPSSWGIPGTIKTLRGLHEKTKSHKHFGIVADNKRYGPKALTAFLSSAENFMKNLQLIDMQSVQTEDSSKESLFIKRPHTSVAIFLEMLAALQTPGVHLKTAASSRVTAADLSEAAAKNINTERTTLMIDQFFSALIKNQQRIRPSIDGKEARVEESKFLIRGVSRKKSLPLTRIKGKRTAEGPLVTYRIDADKFVQITVARIWLDIDPVVEVQFKEGTTDIISMNYFWRLSFRSQGELFAAPELEGKSAVITTDFSQFDQAITTVLKQ